jgi:hypothetical protein
MKENASKRKEMKAKLFLFTFVYFCQLGLFNGLRRIQIKKFASLFETNAKCAKRMPRFFSSNIASASAGIPGTWKDIARIRFRGKHLMTPRR